MVVYEFNFYLKSVHRNFEALKLDEIQKMKAKTN